MRIRLEDDDLRRLYMDPEFRLAGMGPDLIKQYRKKVAFLVNADNEQDLVAYRALRFEKLLGQRAGQHSIRLNDRWRLIVRVETDGDGRLLMVVEVVDYHH